MGISSSSSSILTFTLRTQKLLTSTLTTDGRRCTLFMRSQRTQQPISQCENGASAVTSPALCAACQPSWPACLSPRRNLRCLMVLQVSLPWQCSRRSPSPLLYIVCCDHSFVPGIIHNRAALAAPVVPRRQHCGYGSGGAVWSRVMLRKANAHCVRSFRF